MVVLGVWSRAAAQTLPLAVIADSPYSVARYSVDVPLVMVDDRSLPIIRHADISAVSPTEPLVTCRTANRYVTEARPAVQVQLKRPLYVNPQQHSIPFPAELSVVYGGLRMGLPVGAVIAPVSHFAADRPQLIRVVYAIPAGPLPLQYPYYQSFPYSSAVYPQHQVVPVPQYNHIQPSVSYSPLPLPAHAPAPLYTPQPLRHHTFSYPTLYSPQGPQEVSNMITDSQKPVKPLKPNQVTVLDFPTAVATPEVLFYQPPVDDSELGNRRPPEAIAPAGIIQSTQPVASLETFLNSKESPVLNALREQAEKNKDKEGEEGNEGVEAL